MSDSNSTARFCPKCQAETERDARGICKLCRKASNAAYRAANHDEDKARSAAYRLANPDKVKAYNAAWQKANADKVQATLVAYNAAHPGWRNAANAARRAANPGKQAADKAAWEKANPEKVKAYSAAYRAANHDKVIAAAAVWRAENLDKVKAYNAAWSAANLEATRISKQNRKARKQENGGVLSKGLSAKLFALQKGKCPCCAQPLGDDYHLDHKMPLILGGSNTDDNVQLLRKRCNLQKHAAHPVDFMQKRGFLL